MTVRETTKRSFGTTNYLIGIWVIGAATAAAWSLYWGHVAGRVEATITETLRPVRGLVVERVSVSGWPFRHTVAFNRVSWEDRTGAALEARRISVTASPLNPAHWMLDEVDGLSVGLPGGPRRAVQPDNLAASVRFDRQGLIRFSAVMDGANARSRLETSTGWSVGESGLHLVRDDADPQRYGLSLQLSQVTLSQEPEGPSAILGRTITSARLAGPISQGQALNASLEAWQAAGGQFQLMAGSLLWGPLQLTEGQGTLQLDSSGLWQGELSAQGALMPNGASVAGLRSQVNPLVVDGNLNAYGLLLGSLPPAF